MPKKEGKGAIVYTINMSKQYKINITVKKSALISEEERQALIEKAGENAKIVIAKKNVNVRADASSDADKVGSIKAGDEVIDTRTSRTIRRSGIRSSMTASYVMRQQATLKSNRQTKEGLELAKKEKKKAGCLSRIFKVFSYFCVAIVILAFIGSVNRHSSEDTAAQDESNVQVEQTTSAEKTSAPKKTPEPTNTSKPTNTPKPTATPEPDTLQGWAEAVANSVYGSFDPEIQQSNLGDM